MNIRDHIPIVEAMWTGGTTMLPSSARQFYVIRLIGVICDNLCLKA